MPQQVTYVTPVSGSPALLTSRVYLEVYPTKSFNSQYITMCIDLPSFVFYPKPFWLTVQFGSTRLIQ